MFNSQSEGLSIGSLSLGALSLISNFSLENKDPGQIHLFGQMQSTGNNAQEGVQIFKWKNVLKNWSFFVY